MSYIDIAIVIPLLYGVVKGFSNGLIKEVAGLLGFVFGIYFAVNFSVYLEPKVSRFFVGHEEFVPISTFVVLFTITVISIRFIGYMLDKITQVLALGIVSKFLGAVFGFLKILFLFCFLLFIAKEYQVLKIENHKKTVLLTPLNNFSKQIIPNITKHKDGVLEKIEENTKKAKEKINLQ